MSHFLSFRAYFDGSHDICVRSINLRWNIEYFPIYGKTDFFFTYFRAKNKSESGFTVYCLLIKFWVITQKAELRRTQLNGIGRMHMKGASGCRHTAMIDSGAQQPSQMFLTWVKATTGNSVPYSLRILCGFFNVPQLLATRFVRRDLRLIVFIREDLKV